MRLAGVGAQLLSLLCFVLVPYALVASCCFSLNSFVHNNTRIGQKVDDKVSELDIASGQWWREYLDSVAGNSWFHSWNKLMQAKFDELSEIAENEGKPEHPFRVVMWGDSTMKHQFGAVCGFLAEREGRRFDPSLKQSSSGCCIDTAPGGGRGLCFTFSYIRFLIPERVGSMQMDALYFGSGLHLLHMIIDDKVLEPLRVQEWLAYEALLEDQVACTRHTNGKDVRIAFMTSHTVADAVYTGDFAAVRDAYRLDPGDSTIRAACESQVHAVAAGHIDSTKYWEGRIDLGSYSKTGQGQFTVDTYCEEALMDRHGTLQLNSRARPVMAKLGVPLVDAARIVEGQTWATHIADGRHYHPIVPVELLTFLEVLTSPPPPPLVPLNASSEERNGPELGHMACKGPGLHGHFH